MQTLPHGKAKGHRQLLLAVGQPRERMVQVLNAEELFLSDTPNTKV